MYVHDIEIGTTVLDGKPEVVKETSATALVKGNNLLGPVSALSNIIITCLSYHKVPIISPGLICVPKAFLVGLYSRGE